MEIYTITQRSHKISLVMKIIILEDDYQNLKFAPKFGIRLKNAKIVAVEDPKTFQKKNFQIFFGK
jgi:hypothetical protein